MIADGVHQGYLEVRVMMAGKTHRAPPPRWWRETAKPRSVDWVSDIAGIAQRPGAGALAPAPHASDDGPGLMSVSAFRAAVAAARAEAVQR